MLNWGSVIVHDISACRVLIFLLCEFPGKEEMLTNHDVLYHLQKFTVSKIWEKHPCESKKMFHEFSTKKPRTERMVGIASSVDNSKKNEGVTESVENVETGG